MARMAREQAIKMLAEYVALSDAINCLDRMLWDRKEDEYEVPIFKSGAFAAAINISIGCYGDAEEITNIFAAADEIKDSIIEAYFGVPIDSFASDVRTADAENVFFDESAAPKERAEKALAIYEQIMSTSKYMQT